MFKLRGYKYKVVLVGLFLAAVGALHFFLSSTTLTQAPTVNSLNRGRPSAEFSDASLKKLSSSASHRYWTKVFGIFEKYAFELTGEDLDKAITYNDISREGFVPGSKGELLALADVSLEFWPDFTVKHAKVLDSLPQEIPKSLYNEGTRGVAIVGGGRFSWLAYLAIRAIRETGCNLPVEVLIPTSKDFERERAWCETDLADVNAKCILLQDALGPLVIKDWESKITTYQYKLLAMMTSSFQHVLLLDSDNIVLQNPNEVFESDLYALYGMITWPDYWTRTITPAFYEALGIHVDRTRRVRYRQFPLNLKHAAKLTENESRGTPYHDFDGAMPDLSTEAGQMFINKATHGGTLMLSLYYNVYGPKVFYKLFSLGAQGAGDKDTFVAAAVVLQQGYYQVKSLIHTHGYMDSNNEFQGVAMRHADPLKDFSLYKRKVVAPLFEKDTIYKTTQEQIKYLKMVDKDDFNDQSNIESFSLHCNFPKIDPLTYRDGILYDAKNIRLKHRAYGDLKTSKVMEINGQRATVRVSFELDIWTQMQDILCDRKIKFAYFDETDMLWMCTFIKNQVSWLTSATATQK